MELGGHTETPGTATPGGIPWEERERWGWLAALWRTVTQSMRSPTDFFRRMAPDTGYGAPILFAIIISVVAALGSMIWMPFFWGMNEIPDEVSDEEASVALHATVLRHGAVLLLWAGYYDSAPPSPSSSSAALRSHSP